MKSYTSILSDRSELRCLSHSCVLQGETASYHDYKKPDILLSYPEETG